MKQVLQDLNSGETYLEEVPVPVLRAGQVLIKTRSTLVSAGTERMLVEFGKGNLLQKAQQQPDKVRQVLEKVNTDGLLPTLDAVRNKLDTPIKLGYCNVGEVVESRVDGLEPGQRVVSNGPHAEYVVVPENLCARVPDTVSDESAVFTVIGSIALQGIRLIQPTLGETVVVTGLGLIGLLAAQILRAQGCRVIGIDVDASRVALVREWGCEAVDLSAGEDPLEVAERYTRGRGVDAVLITASTKSNEPIHQAANMCRKRGRIVLVGVVGMELSRADFYEKELAFQVSCSYGPGRYDENYEENGQDYPLAYVRWTEQRNFEAILQLMADSQMDTDALVSERFDFDNAAQAYQVLSEGSPLGLVLNYPAAVSAPNLAPTPLAAMTRQYAANTPVLGFIGAGSYASSVLVPAFAKTGARLKSISSATGVSSVLVGKKRGIEHAHARSEELLDDAEINALVITTRHNSHADWIERAHRSGKHLFIEKPIALNMDELERLRALYAQPGQHPLLMVGFNRRYSPLIQQLKTLLAGAGPIAMTMTVNAGAIEADHWTQDRRVGGGRIVGELCHFVDLLRFLAGESMQSWQVVAMDSQCGDTLSVQIRYDNGSVGQINYFANGNKAVAKERLEVFANGKIAMVDNFRSLRSHGWQALGSRRLWRQDKGQHACATAFVDAVRSGDDSHLISLDELFEVAASCIDIDAQVIAQLALRG